MHGFVGGPVCECAPPLRTCNFRRNDHVPVWWVEMNLTNFSGQPSGQSIPALSAAMIARVMSSSVAPTTRSRTRAPDGDQSIHATPVFFDRRIRLQPMTSPHREDPHLFYRRQHRPGLRLPFVQTIINAPTKRTGAPRVRPGIARMPRRADGTHRDQDRHGNAPPAVTRAEIGQRLRTHLHRQLLLPRPGITQSHLVSPAETRPSRTDVRLPLPHGVKIRHCQVNLIPSGG